MSSWLQSTAVKSSALAMVEHRLRYRLVALFEWKAKRRQTSRLVALGGWTRGRRRWEAGGSLVGGGRVMSQ